MCVYIHAGTVETSNVETWPAMKIVQSMEFSITDALRMSLNCTATVGKDKLAQYDMRWSGMDLEHSLWIAQSHVIKQGDNIEKKITFRPWLDSVAGKYTCHLVTRKRPQQQVFNQSFVISGMLMV